MEQVACLPYHGNINWGALHSCDRFLARRVGDKGDWIFASQPADPSHGRSIQAEEPAAFHFSYDHLFDADRTVSRHPTGEGFMDAEWWTPTCMVVLKDDGARVFAEEVDRAEAEDFTRSLLATPAPLEAIPSATWIRQTGRERYIAQVKRALAHIQQGDIYEINYCTQRTATLNDFDPYTAFARLLEKSDAPFAAFYRVGDHFALCASPERFLRIEGDKVITQPMKGTRRRGADEVTDRALAEELAHDAKERSENIMAVDVARHDLSRIAASRSVSVEELCAVKSYPNVHQMVSTVTARLREGLGPMDAIRAAFPMASMTGAPKIRAMRLIDELEDMRRGLYSGTIGLRLPDGTMDLNVVIRTITYNARTGCASLITGSAITAQSDPEQEWEECELKARSVLNALGHAC